VIIRALLISAIVLIVIWFSTRAASTKRQAGSKLVVFVVLMLAAVTVLFPSLTTDLAHAVGVGRGADLLLYCVTIVFLISLLSTYLQRQRDQRRVEQLARKLAILQANQVSLGEVEVEPIQRAQPQTR
jgi:hypothetical protein